jgi:hypothetical protein
MRRQSVGWTRLMRLPQVSSKKAVVMGPMLVGSKRKVTPTDFKRRNSDWMSSVMKAVAGMSAAERGEERGVGPCEWSSVWEVKGPGLRVCRRPGPLASLDQADSAWIFLLACRLFSFRRLGCRLA